MQSHHLNNMRMQQHKQDSIWQTLNSIDPSLDFNKQMKKPKDYATIKNSPKNISTKMVLKVSFHVGHMVVYKLSIVRFLFVMRKINVFIRI